MFQAYGHELLVMSERMRSWVQAAEMRFLCRVAGLSHRDRVRSLVIWGKIRVESLLLHIDVPSHSLTMPPLGVKSTK